MVEAVQGMTRPENFDMEAVRKFIRKENERINWRPGHLNKVVGMVSTYGSWNRPQKDAARRILADVAETMAKALVGDGLGVKLDAAPITGELGQATQRLIMAAYLAGFAKGWLAKHENSRVNF